MRAQWTFWEWFTANDTLVVKHHPKKHIPKDPKTIMKRHLETELDGHAQTTVFESVSNVFEKSKF